MMTIKFLNINTIHYKIYPKNLIDQHQKIFGAIYDYSHIKK